MAARTGQITPYDTPRTGEDVICPVRGRGVVFQQPKGGGLWIRFPKGPPILYTIRRDGAWRAFPGRADAPGLRM